MKDKKKKAGRIIRRKQKAVEKPGKSRKVKTGKAKEFKLAPGIEDSVKKITSRKIKPEVEAGQEFKLDKEVSESANKVMSRKFKTPKSASLASMEPMSTLAKSDGKTTLAKIDWTTVTGEKKAKRKVKRKKK